MNKKFKPLLVLVSVFMTLMGPFSPAVKAESSSYCAAAVASLGASLPDSVTVKVALPTLLTDPSYFPVTTVNESAGGSISLDGTYNGWCADTDHEINQFTPYSAGVYSSYDMLPVGLIDNSDNLDLANWVINQHYVGKTSTAGGTYNFKDVQRAIWELLEDNPNSGNTGTFDPNRVAEIVTAAKANGEGYVPCVGNLLVILLDTSLNGVQAQTVIIPIPVPAPPPAALGDLVWKDSNHNGVQDSGEPGIGGVTVNLLNSSNTVIATNTTDTNGNYGFTNLAPGTYSLQFVLPTGYVFTSKDQGADDAVDSDADTTTGKTATITLAAGETDLTWDAGLYVPLPSPAALGDFVWKDINHNGIQDTGETGISGVTVKLFDSSNNLVASNTTDTNGIYGFTNLAPGQYFVQFILPASYAFTLPNVGDDAKDSDADVSSGNTTLITLVAGQTDLTWDAGLYVPPAALGDFVWNDMNRNGIQDSGEPGISGVTVNLYNSANAIVGTNTTDANGIYGFTNLAPGTYSLQFVLPAGYAFTLLDVGDDAKDSDADTTGKTATITLAAGQTDLTWDAGLYVLPAALGDFVWKDTNHNGIQDSGEPGVSGVTVNLLNSSSAVISTNITDANGFYGFTNLAPGTYSLQFVLPTGYTFTLANVGDDAKDSDADIATGKTAAITLTAGQTDLTWDAGLYCAPPALASIGNFVWKDCDKDGIQDTGESGVNGVTVKLFDSSNNLVGTTTTNSMGVYGFSNLAAGQYYVQFILPTGYAFTLKDQGTNDALDSDADTATGKTVLITLTAGQTDLTWDAGLYVVCQVPASLGDFVWKDLNHNGIQDSGEPGVCGVTVKLLDSSNNLLKTTTTNSYGTYGFTNLAAGQYYVQFILPSGYTFTLRDQGTNNAVDSDADLTSGKTILITLAAGQTDHTWDAGLYCTPPPPKGGVLLPTNVSVQTYASGRWPAMYNSFYYNAKCQKINNVSPGVMFYYNTIQAPASGNIVVVQTNTANWRPFNVQQGQAYLYDTNFRVVKVGVASQVGNKSYVTFSSAGLLAGNTYYIGIKFTPAGIVGQPVPYNSATKTEYFFSTEIGGVLQNGSADSITLLPK